MVNFTPTVGSKVLIKIKNHTATSSGPWAATTPRDYILCGIVGPLPSWQKDPRAICLLIAGDDIPLRIIHMDQILEVNNHVLETPHKPHTWFSAGSHGQQYTVTLLKNSWRCSCTSFAFRKNCKHIKDLKENPRNADE